MKLVIGENEGKILSLLEQHEEGCRQSVLAKEGQIKSGSVSQSLSQMVVKGWVERYEEGSDQDTLVYFKLTQLGDSALRAWRVYFGEAPC